MVIREHLVNGAVALLQSAEVSYAPQEQKIAFLKAKNLSSEEIDLAFQRASSGEPARRPPPGPEYQNYPPQPSYNNYAYNNAWQAQHPPPELPRRDWRDWFIMATVVGGVGYGVATLAKRYVLPLIAPPTPPQLEQDKASIDAAFDKTFALLDQVVADTQKLKESEQARTERLDAALAEVDAVIVDMKAANQSRERDNERISDDIAALKTLVPKALKSQQDTTDTRLQELSAEMKSLKALLGSRVNTTITPKPSNNELASSYKTPLTNGVSTASDMASPGAVPSPFTDTNGSMNGTPYGRTTNGRAAIPAWQMAVSAQTESAA